MAMIMYLVSRIEAREEGQALVEYGLILAMIALAALVTLSVMGGGVDGLYGAIRIVAQTMADRLGG